MKIYYRDTELRRIDFCCAPIAQQFMSGTFRVVPMKGNTVKLVFNRDYSMKVNYCYNCCREIKILRDVAA